MPKPYRARAVLVILAVAMGCVWLVASVDYRELPESAVSPKVSAERASPLFETPLTAPVNREDEAAAGTRRIDDPVSERLVGSIVDSDGQGIAGIKVSLRTLRRSDRGFFQRRAVSGSQGEFVLDDIDPEGTYMLFTESIPGYPGYRLEGFTLNSLPRPFEIELARLRLIDIEGTIVDAEHAPVANFTLAVDSLDADYPAQIVTSDASGYFRLDAFPAGKLKFFTAEPDYFRILGLQARGERYDNLSLVIDRGPYRLAGRILDRYGEPVASARVTLNSAISSDAYQSVAFRTRHTDASGEFEFTDLGGVSHSLGVYATGYRPRIRNHEFQSFSDRLEIRLF